MKRILDTIAKLGASAALVALLAGCAAAALSMSKKDLDVQARTSTSIFIEPVARNQRTVYLEVRSGVAEFDRRAFSQFVKQQFIGNENGYHVVDDPNEAHFQMLVYVLNLEKTSPDAAHAALTQGYVGQEGAAGAAVGGLAGANSHARLGVPTGLVAGGLLASGGALVANSLVHDVTYMLVCDVSIRERAAKGVLVRKDTQIDTKVSDAGSSRQSVSEATDKKEYRTRIVTTANKANLDLPEAQSPMFTKTAYAMAGFF
jgi:hypothetical protein